MIRRLTAVLVGAVVLMAAAVAAGAPASAAARVSITSDLGTAVASLEGTTAISVSGSGFQSVENGFGGIYVLFGWVDDPSGGSWRPSNGGQTGVDYLYVPDSEAKDNNGYQRFVAFHGSDTAAAANGGEVGADGSWSLQMVIPGPTFGAVDRDGATATVDCREVTCGIITFGAHGVVNANNETFTPVEFVAAGTPSTSQAATEQGSAAPAATAQPAGEGGEAATGATAPASGPATIGLEQSTIIAGRVLTFTGTGFTPGEQVVAVLGAGETGAGPLIAGQLGEVAGAIPLPADLRTGTHVLQLVGAGSGQVAEANLTVMADPAAVTLAEQSAAAEQVGWPTLAVLGAAVVLALVILSSLVTALVRRRRRRREARAGAATAAALTPDDDTAVLPAQPERRSVSERERVGA